MSKITPLPPLNVSLEDMRIWMIQKLGTRGDGKGGLPASGHRLYSILYEFQEARSLLDRLLEIIPYSNQVKKERQILRVNVQTWISKKDTNKARTDYYMLPEYFSFEELQEEIRQYDERQDEASVAEMGLSRSVTDLMGVLADHRAGIPIVPKVESPILRGDPADQSPLQPYLQIGIAAVATYKSLNPARQRSRGLPILAQQSITTVIQRGLPQGHARRSRSSRRFQNLALESVPTEVTSLTTIMTRTKTEILKGGLSYVKAPDTRVMSLKILVLQCPVKSARPTSRTTPTLAMTQI